MRRSAPRIRLGRGERRDTRPLTVGKGGTDIDAPAADGKTLLHAAAEAGRTELVENLLDAGADPETTDDEGKTPLDRAR